jgi:hypothetical protein
MQATLSAAALAVKRLTPSALIAVSLTLLATPVSSGATRPVRGHDGRDSDVDARDHRHRTARARRTDRRKMTDDRYYGSVEVSFVGHVVRSLLCATPELMGRGCPPGFALPDGVSLGTRVPEQPTHWHGYVRADAHPSQYATWNKAVPGRGGNHIDVFFSLYRDKVVAMGESINPDSLKLTP